MSKISKLKVEDGEVKKDVSPTLENLQIDARNVQELDYNLINDVQAQVSAKLKKDFLRSKKKRNTNDSVVKEENSSFQINSSSTKLRPETENLDMTRGIDIKDQS